MMGHNNLKMRIICVTYCLLHLVTQATLEKSTASGESGNYAVLRGSTLKMKCVPKNQVDVLQEDGTSYIWTDEEGKEIIDARFTKKQNGDLEIVNAHVGDSGVFKCKIRPPASETESGKMNKMYQHKLIVYELSGRKFVSTVSIDASSYSKEIILTILKDMLDSKVCRQELCSPATIKSRSCTESEENEESCEFSIPYEALNQMADEKCDEECVRENMFDGLKQAEKILETQLLKMSEDPKGRIKADMKTFDTKHLITCRAGFRLVKAHFKRCFPCLPGYYSGANQVDCSLCAVGFFQEQYGKQKCDKCEEDKTTETMGSKSRDDCISPDATGVLGNLKEGIISLFSG